ncbi:MAG: hypothetical protein J6Q00_03635, partial [Verrucomicrobia bacterium]|nr:hypothetical protein [Verrucomicrobiota bacterium]
NSGKLVIYLKSIDGHPHAYDIELNKDSVRSGQKIFDGKLPELRGAPSGFQKGSTLVTYAPPNSIKLEPPGPRLFFLHGMIGIVSWIRVNR